MSGSKDKMDSSDEDDDILNISNAAAADISIDSENKY